MHLAQAYMVASVQALERLLRYVAPEAGLRRDLIQGSLGSLGVKATYVTIQFLTAVLLARMLGPEGLGVYSLVLAFIGLLVIPAQFGFASLVVRQVAILKEQAQLGLLKGLLRRSVQLVFAAAVLLSLGLLLYLTTLGNPFPEVPLGPLLVGITLLPVLALLQLVGGLLIGLGSVVLGQLPGQVVRPIALLLSLLLIHSLANLTAHRAIGANIGATLFALVVGGVLLRRKAPSMRAVMARTTTRAWVVEAVPFLLLAGSQVINHHADTLMLGLMSGSEEIGHYRVALQIGDGLGMALLALTVVITPHLARLHAAQDWTTIRMILVNAHRAGIALILLPAVALMIFATPALTFIFGPQYAPASSALVILLIGKVGYAGVGFSGVALSMFGLAWVATMLTAAGAALNVVLNLVLIPNYGIAGAAVANATSAFAMSLAGVLWMGYKYGLDFSFLGVSFTSERRETS